MAEPKNKTPSADTGAKDSRTRIVFVHGDKGGVGKSMIAQALADYLSTQGEKVAIVDADTSNPDVSRMFETSLDVARFDLRSENGWMDLMDFIKTHLGMTIILNLPAGIGDYMKKHMDMLALFLSEQKSIIEPELWWAMNMSHDAVQLLDNAIKQYGKYFKKIRVVCNLHFSVGDRDQFFLWKESSLKAKIENDNGLGMTIFFPALHLRVVKKIYGDTKPIPFSDAMDAGGGSIIGLQSSEQFRLKYWFVEVQQAFAPAFGFVPPKNLE